MSKALTALLTTLIFLLSLQLQAHAGDLELHWQTDSFKNPESVVYDAQRGLLYVSNVNGKPADQDGNGFISIVALDGSIQQLEWVTGLDAPKGLAIRGDRLYVADIDTLVEIEIPSGDILNRYTAAKAKFFNDVTAANNGDIYVSDMILNRIYHLHDGKLSLWLEDPALDSPNGLLAQNGQLIVASWGVMTEGFATETPGHLKTVSLDTKSIDSLGSGEPIGNLDGVEVGREGGFYVTDWMAGKLLHISRDGHAELLLDLDQGSADLEYIADRNLLLIPMMNNNSLQAYVIH